MQKLLRKFKIMPKIIKIFNTNYSSSTITTMLAHKMLQYVEFVMRYDCREKTEKLSISGVKSRGWRYFVQVRTYFSMPRRLLLFGALFFCHSICIINSMELSVTQKTWFAIIKFEYYSTCYEYSSDRITI